MEACKRPQRPVLHLKKNLKNISVQHSVTVQRRVIYNCIAVHFVVFTSKIFVFINRNKVLFIVCCLLNSAVGRSDVFKLFLNDKTKFKLDRYGT